MSPSDITTLEHAGRMAMAWVPEGYDGKTHYRTLIAGALGATAIIALTVILLLSLV